MAMKLSVLLFCVLLCSTQISAHRKGGRIILENDSVSAIFDTATGALIGIADKISGWNMMRREVLGQSFELLLPLEGGPMSEGDCRYNVIRGVEQTSPVIEQSGGKLTFVWTGLKSERMREVADITFKGEVRLTGKGLEFSGTVVNDSRYMVEYVSWPCIGEIMVPDKTQPLYQSTRNDIKELFPHFANRGAYWGIDYPTSTYILPEKSFLQVNNRDNGFMFYSRSLPKHTIITSFELIPGFDKRNTNPRGDEMDGQPVRIQFKASHVTYTQSHGTSVLDTLQFAPYKGDWAEGLKLYREDRARYSDKSVDQVPGWLTMPLTWRKIRVRNGDELFQYAEDCVKSGVDVLLVSGWYEWENARPLEVPGLAGAISKCHDLGLRVVLETNWLNTDRYAKGYKEVLRQYVMSDPFGLPYSYGYICPNAPDVCELVKDRWLSLPALRLADGYMNNDHNHSGKSYMCFDKRHRHRFGEPTINGMIKLDAEMACALGGKGVKAALGQGFLEQQNDIYAGCLLGVNDNFYVRHRYLEPHKTMLARVDVKNARRGMNKALLYRMNLVYDLFFYNNRLSDYPHIVEYGNQIKSLRGRYKGYIWDAAFDGHDGISIEGEDIEYSVFVNGSGKRAAVVCNMSGERSTQVRLVKGNLERLQYITPEMMECRPFNGSIELAPLSAVIIMER